MTPHTTLRFVALLVLLLISRNAFAEEPLRTAASRDIDIHHIRIEIDLDIPRKHLSGRAVIDFTPLRGFLKAPAGEQMIELDAVGLDVSEVALKSPSGNAADASFDLTDYKLLVVAPAGTIQDGQRWQIQVTYSVTDPPTGLHFFNPTEEAPHVQQMVWSQGEPQANHYWFPCVDNPNERQSTELLVTVPEGTEVLSNGKLVSRISQRDGRVKFHWHQEKEHVAYLVTLVAGEFHIARDQWRGRPVTYYLPADRVADIERTFGRTKPMLDFFSERFGIEYPWSKYAQVIVEQFTFGGMENTSATTLYYRALHDERAAVDSSPDWLIAHELAHQWWGDLVTCKDWTHLWLNEGFATYSESLWAEHSLGREERDWHLLEDNILGRSGSAKSRPIVDRHYPDPGSMFDVRVYPKGAWVLHMLRSRLGDEDFFRGLQRYGTIMAYQTAETADLRQTFERLYGVSLERFFHDWTERPGHPKLLVESEWLPKQRRMKFHVKQTQDAEPFEIPVRIDLGQTKGNSPTTTTAVSRLMSEREFTEYVDVAGKPDVILVDPEFTLLAEITQKQPESFWKNQLETADVAARIRATNHFGQTRTDNSRKALAACLDSQAFYGVRADAAKGLGKLQGDIAKTALLKGLKDDNAKVRKACVEALSSFENDEDVLAILKKAQAAGDVSYFVESALLAALVKLSSEIPLKELFDALNRSSHRETLRLTALRSLGSASDARVLKVLYEWTERSRPQLCRIEAVGQLVNYANHNLLNRQQTDRIVEHLLDLLEDAEPRLRSSIASALGKLGNRAAHSADRLQAFADREPNDWTRRSLTSAVKNVQTPASTAGELNNLRKELKAAKSDYQKLEVRLERLEAM